MSAPLTHLGAMPIEEFLRDYWQQKPLLIRNALPYFESPISGDELAGLALEEEVESRLVLEHGKTPWELRHGPFDEKTFANLPSSHWTLLVQAIDQWVPEVYELLQSFRFIPNWRLDDIMISYAPDQGSVGPHFDYYDVFLLQGLGKRRWKIGQHCDTNSLCIEGAALNILQDFNQQDEWLLEPGDMLYIPPGIAHWGIAEGDCMTYSIGFRAPSQADILSELSQDIASTLTNDMRFTDPHLKHQNNPGEIGADAIAHVREILQRHFTDENIARWFGKYMTERKYLVDDIETVDELEVDEWIGALQDGRILWRHPAARVAFNSNAQGTFLFADGKAIACSHALAQLLCQETEIHLNQIEPFLGSPTDCSALTQLINQETLLIDE